MKIYKRSFKQDFWVYVLFLICVVPCIGLVWDAITGSSYYKPNFYGGVTGMILFPYLILRYIIGWQLIVTADEIIEKTLFTTKTIPITKIDNYVMGKDTMYLWSRRPSNLLLEITTDSFVGYREFEVWVKENFRQGELRKRRAHKP